MRRSLIEFVPLALLPLARAEGTVQDLWNSPQYPDYTTNYQAGTTITISWQHDLATQFQFFCEDCDITNVDLWLTGSSYTRKLESGVNVNESTSYRWNINLSNEDVDASTDWTFRFLPADVSWGDNDQEISSAKFNLNPSDDDDDTTSSTTTTSTSSTTTTESPTSTTTSTTTTPPAATETPEDSEPEDPDDNGLSTGAKAGIGVGVGAGFIILAALAFLLYRRFKALPKNPGAEAAAGGYNNIKGSPPPPGDEYGQEGAGYFAPAMAKTMPVPMQTYTPVSELHGDVAREMDAGVDAQRPPAELDGGSYPVRH
ncbi:uncharacterized protein BDV17DRAFT_30953 [Aspergillus undulatus]|uniref:uncharacterized protein n=1 Tax=Aspergillus undulatus TaxID=1810928 RepID=UPI003CCE1378